MKIEVGYWKGSEVRYRAGRLFICLKRGVNKDCGLDNIREFCKDFTVYGFYTPGIFEININPALTLKVASDMLKSRNFRFVEIDSFKVA